MSLKRIVLRDFVIVSELDLELADQFTVLTGETGAGKSILIDALQLVTGGRADVGVIREGAHRTEVSAEFDLGTATRQWLLDAGYQADDSLLLRRTVDVQGKSRAWINGSPATASQLRALGEQLLDIHGQHAWQSLTRVDAMSVLLDAYAQTNSDAVFACWQKWRDAQRQLEKAQLSQDSLLHERERLTWQIGEIEKLAPLAQEWPELNAEHARLANAQGLLDAAQGALHILDESDDNAVALLNRACSLLQQQEHIEPVFRALTEVLNSCVVQIQDSLRTLHGYLRKTELDPDRLTVIDDRLSLWVSLARRYKRHPEDLPELLQNWHQELIALETATDMQALEDAQEQALQAYLCEARVLSRARLAAAPKLSDSITQTMQDLGMKGGRFDVVLQTSDKPMRTGLEEVSFLVAGHAGSTPRQIHKVASGGELSRIALAIAVTTSQLGQAKTLIFDEVDAGVGGAVAQTVGRLMQQLGRDRQVLAVTHLPQVAACADHHWVVSKQQKGFETISSVTPVMGDTRVTELARMLGGERIMDSTVAHARDLLQEQDYPGFIVTV